jgi:hypothetical protein
MAIAARQTKLRLIPAKPKRAKILWFFVRVSFSDLAKRINSFKKVFSGLYLEENMKQPRNYSAAFSLKVAKTG